MKKMNSSLYILRDLGNKISLMGMLTSRHTQSPPILFLAPTCMFFISSIYLFHAPLPCINGYKIFVAFHIFWIFIPRGNKVWLSFYSFIEKRKAIPRGNCFFQLLIIQLKIMTPEFFYSKKEIKNLERIGHNKTWRWLTFFDHLRPMTNTFYLLIIINDFMEF